MNIKPTPLLELNNLTIVINHKTILHDINFKIFNKEIITIIGPNGAGKSTLLKAILGLIKITTGTINKIPNLKIGYMPQTAFLPKQIPITVINFLELNQPKPLTNLNVFPGLNIERLYNKSMHTLSGGELQRVLLLRSLLQQPNILILDEPTKSIDLNGQAEFYKLCANLSKELGCAILMASHDLNFVMAEASSVICLNKHICCQGLPATISQHREFLNMFGLAMHNFGFYQHNHDHTHNLSGEI